MKKLFFVPAVAAMMFLASCGGNDTTETTTETPEATTEAPVEAPGADIPGIDDVVVTDHIKIDGLDDMTYDKTLFKVKAGQDVKLTLTNIGKLPKEAMSHNVVILARGADVQAIAEAAIKVKGTHIPVGDMAQEIIAHTELLGPGESETITFQLADPGVYEFICTFPGHWASMRGKIVAE